jgi:predicted O-methyltransferase YrrM
MALIPAPINRLDPFYRAMKCLARAERLRAVRFGGMLRVMGRSLVPDAVERYLAVEISRETALQRRLREETSHLPDAGMQIGADQAALLAMLVRSIGARRAIEIGTFTGYSALAVAAALPVGGKLVCCDVSEEWTGIARRYWQEAGVADRIELKLAPATETLAALIRDGGAGTFDFAFIDADKTNYDAYYESCLTLLRAGGLIALDNMLWSGRVADPQVHDADTDALRALNAKIRDDARVDACLLTVGDGVMLAQKRPTQ